MGYKQLLLLIFASVTVTLVADCNLKPRSLGQMAFKARRDNINEDFPKVPHEEILEQINGNRLYSQLSDAYRASLLSLKNQVDNDCSRLVVLILSHEVGKARSVSNSYGIPVIMQACDNAGIECINVSEELAPLETTSFMQFSESGAWSKKGSALVAGMLADVVTKYTEYRICRKKHFDTLPKTFGDLPPHLNEVINKGKTLTYRLRINNTGFRMNADVQQRTNKQRVVVLGDEKILSPYLDNEFIATELLQRRFPGKEIINASGLQYTMEDFETLYSDKVRFLSPDLVIVCTDGGDILDNYFSQRNHFSRSQRIYFPTQTEEEFYKQLFGPANQ